MGRRKVERRLVDPVFKMADASIERLSMTFAADGKRQRLPLIFYSFLVVLTCK